MKLLLFTACIVASTIPYANPASGRVASGDEDWARKRKEVVKLRADLARLGVEAFVTNAALPKTAPHIHSQCWVDWLPRVEVERKAYEQEKRAFGLDMVGELERLGARSIEMGNVAGLRDDVLRLIAIAEWMKTSYGYGNYILKHQAEEQALSLIAKLSINRECEPREIRELLGRIDTHAMSAFMQVAILNEESPHRYERPSAEVGSEIQSSLGRQWGAHKRKAKRYFEARYPNRGPLHFGDVKSEAHEYAFYIPDRNLGDASIRRYWDLKDHEEVCVYGMYSQKRDKIEWILKFRECIGPIPLPTADELKDETSQERYVGKVNDLWLVKGHPSSVKPIGRIVMWICQDMFM